MKMTTDPPQLTSLEQVKYDKLMKRILEHEHTISHREVIGPFTGNLVHAYDADWEYSLAMWKLLVEELELKYEVTRDMPEWAPCPENERKKPDKKKHYSLS